MKIIHFSFLTAILVASTFANSSSCKKKKKFCKSGTTCRSVLEAKDFFLFKEGSWWVYEEETTHERDSQYVYEYHNTSGYDFDMRVHCTFDGYDYHFWPVYASGSSDCSEVDPVNSRCVNIFKNKGMIGDYVGEGKCFFINYNIGDWSYAPHTGYSDNKIYISNIHSTYSVLNSVFNNVIEIKELKTLIEDNQETKQFYTKNIGLIRKELIDSNKVWNLVNYHIEQ